MHQIPIVDVGPLFAADPTAWVPADRALFAAARTTGFASIGGLAPEAALGPLRRARIEHIPPAFQHPIGILGSRATRTC
jgi:isopenicillin N synthase-like dioxygenase